MRICWPSMSPTFAVSSRATMSTGPPGAKGTKKWIGFVGQACANAFGAIIRHASHASVRMFKQTPAEHLIPALRYSSRSTEGSLMPQRKITRQDLREAAEKFKNWGKWG